MDAREALRLQAEWGADEALLPQAVDRRRNPGAAAASAASARAAPAPMAGRSAATRAEPVAQAEQDAAAAATMHALQAALQALNPGGLAAAATHFVWTGGNPQAPLLLLADAPGEAEDRSGTAFAGAAGELLDRILDSIGLDRAHVRLAYVLPWRPPGGRPASELEVACCLPFLYRRLALHPPQRAVALGTLAARVLLGKGARARGRWAPATVPGLAEPLPVLSTPHPAQLLDRPTLKPAAWADWRLLHRTLRA